MLYKISIQMQFNRKFNTNFVCIMSKSVQLLLNFMYAYYYLQVSLFPTIMIFIHYTNKYKKKVTLKF